MYQISKYTVKELQVLKMFNPHSTYKHLLLKKVEKQVERPHDFMQYIRHKQDQLQQMIVQNRIQQFINTKFYYENVSRRARVSKINANKIIRSTKTRKEDPKLKFLQFKVEGFRKKLILLRQHKIKKDTYLRMFITKKLSGVFPYSLQVYNSVVGVMKYMFLTIPMKMTKVVVQNSFVQKITYVMSRSFSFVYWVLYNIGYFFRLFGVKTKFLWDTLNHYLLIKQIGWLLWRQKSYVSIGAMFLLYFGYLRETYFINTRTQKILMFELLKDYERELIDKAKQALIKDVFANTTLPDTVAPQLVNLVQMPKIKNLMTDLFIVLLRNPAFKQDTDRLVGNIIHDYLRGEQCQRLFTELILNQVLRNEEVILSGMFNLLKDYVLGSERQFLTGQGADVLKAVLLIKVVEDTVIETVVKECQGAMENPEVLNAAVRAALNSIEGDKNKK